MIEELTRHPIAALFPEIEGAAYTNLVVDIRDNGQLEPIELWKGQIIDGWNRYRACLDAGVIPRIKEVAFDDEHSLIKYVKGKNFLRRDLTPAQRADIAIQISKTGHVTIPQAAETVGVSVSTVVRAKRKVTGGKRSLRLPSPAPDPLAAARASPVTSSPKPTMPPSNEAPKIDTASEPVEMYRADARLIEENARLRAELEAERDRAATWKEAAQGKAAGAAISFDTMSSDNILDLAKRLAAYLVEEAPPAAQKLADALAAAGVLPERGPSRPIQLAELAPGELLKEVMERAEDDQRAFFQAFGATIRKDPTRNRGALLMLVAYNAMDIEGRTKVHRLIMAAAPGGAGSGGAATPGPNKTPGSDSRRPGDPVPRDELHPPGSLLKGTGAGKKLPRANGSAGNDPKVGF